MKSNQCIGMEKGPGINKPVGMTYPTNTGSLKLGSGASGSGIKGSDKSKRNK